MIYSLLILTLITSLRHYLPAMFFSVLKTVKDPSSPYTQSGYQRPTTSTSGGLLEMQTLELYPRMVEMESASKPDSWVIHILVNI